MIRGYNSQTLIKYFPRYFIYNCLFMLNFKIIQIFIIILYMERFGVGMLLPLCMLLSKWYVRFGAGMLVPLKCRCKVLVQGVACCQSGLCSLERACWWRSGCCCRFCLREVLQIIWSGYCQANLLVLLQGGFAI